MLRHGVLVPLAVHDAAFVCGLGSHEVAQLGGSAQECWRIALVHIEQVFAEEIQAHFCPAELPNVVDLILCGDS